MTRQCEDCGAAMRYEDEPDLGYRGWVCPRCEPEVLDEIAALDAADQAQRDEEVKP